MKSVPRTYRGRPSLAEVDPALAAQWHPERNLLTPLDVTPHSNKKAWWIGPCGHEWETTIDSRSRGQGCSVCVGRRVVPGLNDLATTNPELAKEWSDRNDKSITQVTAGSHYMAEWVCGSGHTWTTKVQRRAKRGQTCAYCSGRDLESRWPDVAKQWHPTLNEGSPRTTKAGSNKRVWWLCECGHEWQAQVCDRTRKDPTKCPECAMRTRALKPGVNDLPTVAPELESEWSARNVGPFSEAMKGSLRKTWWVGKCGHEWKTSTRTRVQGFGCPRCSATEFSSNAERELTGWLSSLTEVRANDRILLSGSEVDAYLPLQRVAIEFNGLYWHSERWMSPARHWEKTQMCAQAGVELIHVWEDDWRDRKDVVKRMIARKIGKSSEERLNARSLNLATVTHGEAKSFLDKNHVQGPASGSGRFALVDGEGRPRAVLVARKRHAGEFEIVRYASDALVRGGFSRLMRHAEKELRVSKWVTFAARDVSDGGLYEVTGFVKDGEIPPDYAYVVANRRVHKFNYRKARFKSDPDLKYEEGLTERELADLNGLYRIYDAGKIRYVRET